MDAAHKFYNIRQIFSFDLYLSLTEESPPPSHMREKAAILIFIFYINVIRTHNHLGLLTTICND
jgi:hypothetical protein